MTNTYSSSVPFLYNYVPKIIMSEENRTNNEQNQQVQSEETLREKVFKTCDNMHSQGKKITRAAVRECTGGSDRDLSKYINEWKNSKQTVQDNDDESLQVGTVSSERDALTVQSDDMDAPDSESLAVQNQSEELSTSKDSEFEEAQEITANAYSNEPADDVSRIARRGAERAAALLVGEDAVVAHLLENPDKLPEDLRKQVEAYKAKTTEKVDRRQEQYSPDFFAAAAVKQFR